MNRVLVPILMPYIAFYYKHHQIMDLNLKGQALDILNTQKDIELRVSQTKEGFAAELLIPYDLCEESTWEQTEKSQKPGGHEYPSKNSKTFSNQIKEKAISEAHTYLVSLFR